MYKLSTLICILSLLFCTLLDTITCYNPYHISDSITADTICNGNCVGIIIGLVVAPILGIAVLGCILFLIHKRDPSTHRSYVDAQEAYVETKQSVV